MRTINWTPTTRLGWVALILSALSFLSFVGLSGAAGAFGGIEAMWVGAMVGVLFIFGGLVAGVLAELAIFRAHERAILVFVALAPAAIALFFLVGEAAFLIVYWLTGVAIH
ncbi:MAG TPA: hypothetical protein VK902_06130 [Rubrobacter sp.]|nr:hypothetical protein [Rubrobacter sp.]